MKIKKERKVKSHTAKEFTRNGWRCGKYINDNTNSF